MKILFVIGSLEIGGAEKQMVLLIEQLVKSGIECEVFSLEGYGPLNDKLNELNVNVHDGSYCSGPGKTWFIRQILKSIFKLNRVIHKNQFDVVHSYLPLANFLSAVTLLTCRVDLFISSRRALSTHRSHHPAWQHLDKITNLLSHKITVNSMAVLNDVQSHDQSCSDKLHLIYNGINVIPYQKAKAQRIQIRFQLGIKASDVVIVMVANLIPYKGHKDVVNALNIIKNELVGVKVLFIGEDRGIKTTLEALLYENNLSDVVSFLGFRSDIPQLLAAADIGLIASHEEGFCNSLLEMMASELLIIATNVGGNAEALDNGRLGVLISAHSPQSIAEALRKQISNKKLKVSYRSRAIESINQNYSLELMLAKYLKLYAN